MPNHKRYSAPPLDRLALVLLGLMTQVALSAQAVSPASASSRPQGKEEDEAVVLTPFMVEVEDNEGYQANSTLAGTRIRTDLGDTASAISVVTKQFLRDTGVTGNQDLLVYTPSTEVGGLGGNFSGFGGVKVPNEAKTLINPSSNNRVRGLDSADNTRDYFLTDIPWDSFNVGRIDLQRGPNSILFGVGSPAGIINASTNDASFKRAYRVENVVDQYGSVRNALDLNHVLLKNQLAIRVSAVDDRKKFQQEPAFNDQRRIYGALRFDPKLFGNENKTSFRVKYERGDVTSNNPRMLPPGDRITPWFQDPYQKATINTLSAGNGSLATGNKTLDLYKPGGNTSFQGLTSTVDVRSFYNGASSAGVIPGYSNTPTGVIVGMINAGIPGLNSQAYRPLAVPTYSQYALGTKIPGGAFYLDKVLTDSTVYDFYNNLLDGDNKREWQDWDAQNFDFQQTFFKDRIALNLTYDRQSYLGGQIGWLTGSDYSIGVEVNQTYADGSTNPNVGRAYVTGTDSIGNFKQQIDRTSKRAILTADLNSKDLIGDNLVSRVIGRSVFTGLVAADTKDGQTTLWAQHATTPDLISMLGLSAQSVGALVGTRQYDWLYYTGPSLKNAGSAAGANLDRIRVKLEPGSNNVVKYFKQTWIAPASVDKTAPFTYLDFNTNKQVTGTQADNPANYAGWDTGGVNWLRASNPTDYSSLVTGGERTQFEDKSEGFTWQGYLLNGDLVPTFGWRRDSVTNLATAAPKNSTTGIAAMDYALDPNSYREAAGQSRNWSGVYHLPKVLTDRLPLGTKVSVLYNDSSNFKADAPRRNLLGDIIANPQGSTREKGIVITTLNDKVTIRANWFKTQVSNATLASGGSAIFGGGAYNFYQLAVFGYMQAGILQDAMNGVSDGQGTDEFLGGGGWTNYAFASGVSGVKVLDNLKNTNASSAYQQAQQTKDAQAAIAAWSNLPAFMNKDFYKFWNSPVSIDPTLAKSSGRITSAYGATSPFTGLLQLISALSPAASTLPVSTVDTLADGQEFEIGARPIKNWNISLNYVRTFATRTNVDKATVQAMNQFNSFYMGDAGKIRMYGQTSPTFLISETWKNNLWLPYQVLLASQGQSAPEVAPWRLNAVSTYEFDRGRLKGLLVGGALRWEAGKISGYRYSSALGFLDVNQPLMGPTDQHLDVWVGYSRKLKYRDMLWKVQLNVRNLGEGTRLVPAYYEPDGSLALARIQTGMLGFLTNSLEF